jgi:ABC-type branched-subunit amino acid transport system substrate-binding protein
MMGACPGGGRASIRRLEGLGALGVIGPLFPEVLAEAIAARQAALPIISPTALPATESAPGVFALSGPDTDGARALARHAHSVGLQRVVVMRTRTEVARMEAAAFREEIVSLGGTITAEILYDPSATSFRDELTQVARSRPDGLFLPLGPNEIELLAPQLTCFGVDTLGIQLLGTSGWTSDDVLSGVDPRHTDGVVASTNRIGPEDMEAFDRFRVAYERLFRKTLRSQVPAFGYDAASLFLHALQSRPRDAMELTRALNQIRGFPGATGRLSIEGGRVARVPRLVQIQGRELVPLQNRSH